MRYMTAGESHGKGITAILEGVPSNLFVDKKEIDKELKRRQLGYGRGGRMKIETDCVEIVSGIRGGVTTGAPITLFIKNRDYENWQDIIGADATQLDKKVVTKVRPGHADLSGCIKYAQSDARNVLERASARETAARVAVGAVCKILLRELGIKIGSHVVNICGAKTDYKYKSVDEIIEKSDLSEVRCLDEKAAEEMKKAIDFAKANGDTAGGAVEIVASGMPVGIGSHAAFDRKLDYIISGHLMSVQSVKCVEIGLGYRYADVYGSAAHDEIFARDGKIYRETNNAGGIEGGISNGEDIVVRCTLKPIPTLMKGLRSIDLKTREAVKAEPERSDYCAVPAGGVVLEAALAFALCVAVTDTLGGDNMQELKERMKQKRAAENGSR